MASLINKTNGQVIVKSVENARSFWQKAKGLLGKSHLSTDLSLWIAPCKSIHTFFMQFPIDVIFTDKNLCVVSIFHAVPSKRIIFGGFKSHSVFEMKAGKLKDHKLSKGDQLYVGH